MSASLIGIGRINSDQRYRILNSSGRNSSVSLPSNHERRVHLVRTLIVSCVLLPYVSALPVLAQIPLVEYGHPSELRGVQKVFVDAGTDAR